MLHHCKHLVSKEPRGPQGFLNANCFSEPGGPVNTSPTRVDDDTLERSPASAALCRASELLKCWLLNAMRMYPSLCGGATCCNSESSGVIWTTNFTPTFNVAGVVEEVADDPKASMEDVQQQEWPIQWFGSRQ